MHRLACVVLSHGSHTLLLFFPLSLSVSCFDWVFSIILTFRPLIHSMSFTLLLIASTLVFISATELSNFSLIPLYSF